jgi:cell wall-associated NlpC family hydrolase
MTADEKRKLVVDEAMSWLGTPWHHEARLKKAGVDCGMFILEVFEKCNLIPHIEPVHYSRDFMLHRNEEWYLKTVLMFGYEINGDFLPGDVALFKHGRIFSHGAIIKEWPMIIHSWAKLGCVCESSTEEYPILAWNRKIFRYKEF